MLDVLLVKIQPTDLPSERFPKDFESFPTEKPLEFKISVPNIGYLHFTVSKEYYLGSDDFYQKAGAINDSLGVKHGGHIIAIDKYPASQFTGGVDTDEERYSGYTRYEVECRSTDFTYDSVVLLVPGLEPIVLADLNFAYGNVIPKGYCSCFIVFEKEAVLSVTLPFGEVKGITLKHCGESALNPNAPNLRYTMSFEKISLPEGILQKLLETKTQLESEPHEETHG